MNRTGSDPEAVEQAFRAFHETLAQRPDDPEATFGLGWAHHHQGDHEEAARLYGRALERLYTSSETHSQIEYFARYNLGLLRLREHSYEAAILEFHEATGLRPGEWAAWYRLGLCFAALRRYAEAIDPLARAASLRPDDGDVRFNLGLAHWRAGQHDQADAQWRETVRLRPWLEKAVHRIRRRGSERKGLDDEAAGRQPP